MKKLCLAIAMTGALAGCNDSDSPPAPAVPLVSITGTGGTHTLTRADLFDLTISSQNATISLTATGGINNLLINGSNNMVTFTQDTAINSFLINGNDNTISKPTGSGITYTDNGAGNMTITF